MEIDNEGDAVMGLHRLLEDQSPRPGTSAMTKAGHRRIGSLGVVVLFALLQGCAFVKPSCRDDPATTSPSPIPFIDTLDSTRYDTVQIGARTWMTRNLDLALPGTACAGDGSMEGCARYGRLYTHRTALGACPDGWRLASDSDWNKIRETAH